MRTLPGYCIPLDLDRAGHAADPVPFGAGAYIDHLGAGGELQHIAGFARRQFALVGALQATPRSWARSRISVNFPMVSNC